MDQIFAIKGKDFALVAVETTVVQSIIKLKTDDSKSLRLDDSVLLSMSGETSQRWAFGPLIEKNIKLRKFLN